MLLMIDNYDSFTFNLVQYFAELGEEVRVFRNDEIALEDIAGLQPARLVLSPGPCTPHEAGAGADPQSALVDGHAKRAPTGADQAVVDDATAELDVARAFLRRRGPPEERQFKLEEAQHPRGPARRRANATAPAAPAGAGRCPRRRVAPGAKAGAGARRWRSRWTGWP